MSDLEMTRLCAVAIGWKHLGAVGIILPPEVKYPSQVDARFTGKLWCLSGGNDWWETPTGETVCGLCESIPDPLNDDSQAMALVKKFNLAIQRGWNKWTALPVIDQREALELHASDDDLNRAIVKCVATMQKVEP